MRNGFQRLWFRAGAIVRYVALLKKTLYKGLLMFWTEWFSMWVFFEFDPLYFFTSEGLTLIMIVTLTIVSALAFLSLCFSLLQRLCWRVTETSLLELSGFHPLTIISYSRIQSPRAPSAAAPTQSHWSSQWTAKGEIDLFPSFPVMFFFSVSN